MSPLLRSLTVIVLSVCLVAGSARASQVVFGNLGDLGTDALNPSASVNPTTTTWFAQGFTVGGGTTYLNSVSIGIGGTGTATVALYTNNGGVPGSFLQSVTQNVAGSTLAPTLQSFNFGSLSLASSASYWVVVNASIGFNWVANLNDITSVGLNSSGWNPSSPVALRSLNSGTNWSTSTGGSVASLSITASSTPEPIPEPGTWAAAALLIGAAAYVRWRRRPRAA
jgi:hypothetical protein